MPSPGRWCPVSGIELFRSKPPRRLETTTIFMLNYLAVMLGGALGTGARFWVSGMIAQRFGEAFPLGTLVINVTGSFIIGFFAELTGPDGVLLVRPIFRQFFMIGVCGGYTTFSSFSLQTLNLARDREWLWAIGNTALSVLLCLGGVWIGHAAAEWLNKMRV
jgi:fluoride exporter